MKIAFLLGSLNRGGTETLLLDVFRNARKNGLNAIGIFRKSGVLEKDFLDTEVEMKHLPTEKNIFIYLLRLRNYLKNNNVEIAHAQQAIDGLYAWIACLGTNVKVVLTFHGYDFTERPVGLKILRFIIKKTDLNIYVSETQRQYYQQKYKLQPEKQQVVYNGISFDKFDTFDTSHIQSTALSRAPGNTESLRSELKLSTQTLLIGAVGNFNEVRDQMTTCKFLKLLHEQQVDFHFVFVGKQVENSASLYDNCVSYCSENRLKERVSFLGMRTDVPQILSELDAFVYSTNHDTFGIALVEAMAVGIPVFVNDWGVMNEITCQGKYATLYKSKDEYDLLREFMLFLQNKPYSQNKAKEATEFVKHLYSIREHIVHLKNMYKLLLTNG
jgi:glycosyltransferase involved in cell wall biosynthesis